MTLWQEALAAGRGVIALLFGRWDAEEYFDVSLRGFIGSCAATLIAMLALIVLFLATGVMTSGSLRRLLFTLPLGFGAHILTSAFILRLFGKPDRLMAYLVATTWMMLWAVIAFVVSIGASATLVHTGLLPHGPGRTLADIAIWVLTCAKLVLAFNLLRILVGLGVWRSIGFLFAMALAIIIANRIISSLGDSVQAVF